MPALQTGGQIRITPKPSAEKVTQVTMIEAVSAEFDVRLARTAQDREASQRLRYQVFVEELGGDGPLVDHAAGLERDMFDPFCDHLLLVDRKSDRVAGVYRLLLAENAARAGRFYTSSEYDLAPLLATGQRLLELGRSCLHPDFRGGTAMYHMWSALARYVSEHKVDILFGVASFHGTDITKLAAPLSLLHQRHLAPVELRVRALDKSFQNMDLVEKDHLDTKSAMVQIPSLIKAYLRLGGYVGEGAFVDHRFNTTDVCLIMETARMSKRQARIYGGTSA